MSGAAHLETAQDQKKTVNQDRNHATRHRNRLSSQGLCGESRAEIYTFKKWGRTSRRIKKCMHIMTGSSVTRCCSRSGQTQRLYLGALLASQYLQPQLHKYIKKRLSAGWQASDLS
ncbi:Piso0_005224 [Millerozyma farinosa CBS 7064]|uniref:Piso0_005224 protein n=1 Tax=Pichia sorbitophila (strain ATCC MYA-4447 / BCRC 22081 / CBS 7064 / NBRC 10061 / NRRL Y-12695) TaxID=559304 RepID=G8Y4J2_PICSO|nr:Piso0_005224 [Millerozyma farinosa CBS 7064]